MTSAAGKAHGAGLLPERPREGDVVDDPIDADAATRTSTPAPAPPAQLDSPANHVGEIAPARLPAPLQYRDPTRYDILGEHGRGGLGRVFRARDREMGRDVAVKELLNRGASSELRFFREALITARLEHPGIVPVHEAGRWPDGTPFYAMKLVAGRPLKVLFENARTVEARLALLPHILAVADAIAYAHDRKIIHRDLKPANVIVGEFGETVVIDWGLAKDISPEAEDDEPSEAGPYRTAAPTPGVTVAGSVLGTPAYMAPEQARGELVDERADVYAIGAMLFQVCTGEKTPPTDVYKLHHSLGRSGVDVDLVSIVRKACAPEAGGRYRDAGKLAADLRSFTAGARVLARHYSAGALVSHWVKRHKRLAAAVAVMVVTLGVVGVVAFARVKEERDRAEKALIASREAGVREEEARKAAETERDAARAAQVRELLVRDPTKALPIAEQLPKTPENELLLARVHARPVATWSYNTLQTSIQDAILSQDGDKVALRTGDSHIIEIDLSAGTATEVDAAVYELTPLVDIQDGWAYVKLRAGITTVVIGRSQMQWDSKPPIDAIAALGSPILVLSNSRLLATKNGAATTILDGVSSVAGTNGTIAACLSTHKLLINHGSGFQLRGRCAATGERGELVVSGTTVAAIADREHVVRLDSRGSREFASHDPSVVAVSSTGALAVVNLDDSSWYASPSDSKLRRGPTSVSVPSAIAADGARVGWAYRDGTAQVWDTQTGQRWRLQAGTSPIHWLFIHEDTAVTVSGQQLRMWKLPPQALRAALEQPCFASLVYPSKSHNEVALQCASGSVDILDVDHLAARSLHKHAGVPQGAAWFNDQLCTGGRDGTIRCSNRSNGNETAVLSLGSPIATLLAAPDSLLVGTERGDVWKWTASTSPRRLATLNARPEMIRLASDTSVYVASLDGGLARLVDSGSTFHDTNGQAVQLPARGVAAMTSEDALFIATQRGEIFRFDGSALAKVGGAGAPTSTLMFLGVPGEWASVENGSTLCIHLRDSQLRVDLGDNIRRLAWAQEKGLVAASIPGAIIEYSLSQKTWRVHDLGRGQAPLIGYLRDGRLVAAIEGTVFVQRDLQQKGPPK